MVTGAIRAGSTVRAWCSHLGTLSLLATGALLVLKVPENRLSWVMLFVALGDGLMNAADGSEPGSLLEIVGGIALFARRASWPRRLRAPLVPHRPGPDHSLALGLGRGDGWRALVSSVGWAHVGSARGRDRLDVDSCVSVATCANILGLLLILVGIVAAAIVSLVVRWIRSRGVERLQMKWLVLAFVVFLIGVLAEFGGFPVLDRGQRLPTRRLLPDPGLDRHRRHQISAVRGRSNPVPNRELCHRRRSVGGGVLRCGDCDQHVARHVQRSRHRRFDTGCGCAVQPSP